MWERLHPGDPGLTYDPKANPMLVHTSLLASACLTLVNCVESASLCLRPQFEEQDIIYIYTSITYTMYVARMT